MMAPGDGSEPRSRVVQHDVLSHPLHMTFLDRSRWLILLPGVLALTVCNADDDDTATSAGTTTAATDTSTSSATMTTTGSASMTGVTAETGSTADTISDTTSDTTAGSDDTGTNGTTNGEACAIELPPPGTCNQNAPESRQIKLAGVAGPTGLAGTDELIPEWDPQPGGGNFIDPTDGEPVDECDIWEQDCPDGQKCMPWDNSGQGAWNATKCTPLDPNAVQIGEDCMVEGSGVSGVDNCELGSMCFAVDPETNVGTCIEFCSCSETNPICETPNTFCSISNQGVLILCLPPCNPLDPEACGTGEGCYPNGDYFVCAPNASDPNSGFAGDPCQYLNVCNHGLMCAGAQLVPGCASSACCTSFCDIGDDSQCLNNQSCIPFYEPGGAPDACLGEVGVCVIP
jgi:hypothetical protein